MTIRSYCKRQGILLRDRFHLALRENPHRVALGMAVGLFVSATPFFPFHTSIAVVLAMVLKGSRIAAAAGVWFSNPLTMPIFYFSSYKLGAAVLGRTDPLVLESMAFRDIINAGVDITWAMIIGGVAIGVLLSIPGYLLTLRLIATFRKRQGIELPDRTDR